MTELCRCVGWVGTSETSTCAKNAQKKHGVHDLRWSTNTGSVEGKLGTNIVESVQTHAVSGLQTHGLKAGDQFSYHASCTICCDGPGRMIWVNVYLAILVIGVVAKGP